ncbi:nitrogen regulatory protein P-II 1 [Wenyingzhuangia heitensis]|uniref:Nitrogen regulatory protein P-II 1 n=1 Tax=Wenyingzhuangia heitensis TaxID=1487859 RepID=A0ABX0UFY2_9FLAO|nr:P-II family nitrogen regulator [Wenyingzhuangia heitensis]NIJ46096.1 nitrogen regulatory protein P-II 1 [Wenyingzhuangia heitensis]
MKKIEAIIRKSKFSEVKEALHDVGVNFFSYWDVTGLGNEKVGKVYRGVSFSTNDIQRRQLAIIVNDDFEKITVETLLKTASTGEVGDGKVFVSDVSETYRIRTGEKGSDTLK